MNNTLMSPDEVTDYLVDAGKLTIESDNEFLPIVVTQDMEGIVIPFLLGVDKAGLNEALGSVLASAALMPLHMASFSVDSYYAHWSKDRFAAEAAKGPVSLREHFEAGDPTVSECLMIYLSMDDAGVVRTRGWSLPYKRTDDGIVWDEPRDETPDSRIPKALEMALVLSSDAA